MEKTNYYVGRIKSHNNTVAALKTKKYYGKECVDTEGFTYRIISEDEAKGFWEIFDFEIEVGKVMSVEDAMELADFCDKIKDR